MGTAASAAGATATIDATSDDELKASIQQLDEGCRQRLRAALQESPKEDGLPVTHGSGPNGPRIIGSAPHAQRPEWLPTRGKGQANVDPQEWSMSIEQWIFFVRACAETETWAALVKMKGEKHINMYDMCTHFVVPWTRGTGSSIALLMNHESPVQVEMMLSHSWGGSVVETYNCLQNAVNHYNVPVEARVFFCTFSLYQPNDDAAGGLSIGAQVAMAPFMRIIESNPKYGMYVLHTTTYEVYKRLWVVHEADIAVESGIKIQGLFDLYIWDEVTFGNQACIDTREGECGNEDDKKMIHDLITKREGDYDRLNKVIGSFRKTMQKELCHFLSKFGETFKREKDDGDRTWQTKGDWSFEELWWGGGLIEEIEWKHLGKWVESTKKMAKAFDVGNDVKVPIALPLGEHATPYGPPRHERDFRKEKVWTHLSQDEPCPLPP